MHVPIDERADRWMSQASADLGASEELRERFPHLACFHAQQAAEKAVKALLTRLSGDALPTHELERLLVGVEAVGIMIPETVRSEARSLEKYYVATRYPDALGFADAALTYQQRDAVQATASAVIVLDWCVAQIEDARRVDPTPP